MPPKPNNKKVRIAAVGDLHYREDSAGLLRELFVRMSRAAQIAVLCGDLTDHGQPEQARVLAADLEAHLSIPKVAVLGNHDHESGREAEVASLLRKEAAVQVLDGDSVEIAGVGFAGTKGFCGGFGRATLEPWGERVLKQFVQEAVDESMKLENGLAKLRTDKRVAVLHYAPIRETVEGELPEIVPYLGSHRLVEPINTFGAIAALHGHAHHGSPMGRTSAGIPVYNCALPLLRKVSPDTPFRVIEV